MSEGPLHQKWNRVISGVWETTVDDVTYRIEHIRPFYRLHISTETNCVAAVTLSEVRIAAQWHYEQRRPS